MRQSRDETWGIFVDKNRPDKKDKMGWMAEQLEEIRDRPKKKSARYGLRNGERRPTWRDEKKSGSGKVECGEMSVSPRPSRGIN